MATPAAATANEEEACPVANGTGTRRPGRLDYIEGLRGIAAFYVVLQHICTMVDPHRLMLKDGAKPAWLALAMRPLWYGHLAVAAFIVISGFCLQLSLYNRGDGSLPNLRKFLLRRCERILPPYYACLVLSIIVCLLVTQHQIGLPFEQYVPLTAANVAAHFLMVHNLSIDWMYKINGVLWSIAIEFQLYFAFPFFVWALVRRGRWPLLSILGVLAAAVVLMVPGAPKMYVWYVPLFALGMAMAYTAFDGRAKKPVAWISGSIAAVAACATVYAVGAGASLPVADSIGGVAVAGLLLFGAAAPGSFLMRTVGSKPLVKLGTFSYSLYLLHHPIMQVVYVLRPAIASTPVRQVAYLVAVGVPIILAACYGFFWVFERPFVKARRK
jgi:peptidoglycan/LPS O-acetylase OafA/YrhL